MYRLYLADASVRFAVIAILFVQLLCSRDLSSNEFVQVLYIFCFIDSAGLTHKQTKRALRAPSCKGAPSKTGQKLFY